VLNRSPFRMAFRSLQLSFLTLCNAVRIFHVPNEQLLEPIETLPKTTLYPHGVRSIHHADKPEMKYGTPTQGQMDIAKFVETIPIETRLNLMQGFRGTYFRHSIPKLLNSVYERYIVSSLFIDVRLLRLLAAFAVHRLEPDQQHIQSATDIIAYFTRTYPNENFEYLTPDYVLEWYSVLGRYYRTFACLSGEMELLRNPDSTRPLLVQLPVQTWKEFILIPRMERLVRTGYEFMKQPGACL
jgi:hypothetical protein